MNEIVKFSIWCIAGYLQQEKLLATCREFILESSDLKEYAEHCTEDGFIPACLLVSLYLQNRKLNCLSTMEKQIEISRCNSYFSDAA